MRFVIHHSGMDVEAVNAAGRSLSLIGESRGFYQMATRSTAARRIGAPSGTLKAVKKSSKFDRGPFVRNSSGECGSVEIRRRRDSGLTEARKYEA